MKGSPKYFPPDYTFSITERRSSISLSIIFMLRMLGLFLLLPVFVLNAKEYPGGQDTFLVGLAFGAYGFTQALLQIPYGLASDRFGRKPVIFFGLMVFIVGSIMAAVATDVMGLFIGRAIQGAGAVSAVTSALLADQTREIVRTKAMAIIGASIGLSFALSLVLAPPLTTWIGLSGLFWFTTVLALMCIVLLCFVVPNTMAFKATTSKALNPKKAFGLVLSDPVLLRLNIGVLLLHMVQTAMWLVVPYLLVQSGLPQVAHWQVYLPAVLLSFVLMAMTLFKLERAGYIKPLFLACISFLGLSQIGLMQQIVLPDLWILSFLLFLFFVGFNALEALQPSLVSRAVSSHYRGAAMGVYGTMQSIGLFLGGFLGGWILQRYDLLALLIFCTVVVWIWFTLAWKMPIGKLSNAHPHISK
jgi:MFS family permease